jgi:hypothetical protein
MCCCTVALKYGKPLRAEAFLNAKHRSPKNPENPMNASTISSPLMLFTG